MKNSVLLFIAVLATIVCCHGTGANTNSSNFKSCLTDAGIQLSSLVERGSPESEKYKDLNFQRQLRGLSIKPFAFLLVKTATDIQAAVNCGRSLGIPLVPKGGGHSYEKYSFGNKDSVIIDLQLMDSVVVNQASRTVDVGPGNLIGPLTWRLHEEGGFLLPTGECPTVGISGIATGGGCGFFTRTYGLTTDNIVEAEVVTADGKLLKVNSTTNSDLFWAIRGAGSQSFGIVSKFTFRIYKAPKNVIIAKKFYPIKKFPEVFSLYQNLFASGLSNQIFLQLAIVNRQVTILLTGPSEISTKIREILDKFPPRPTKNTYNTLSFKDFLFQSALESYQRFADGALEKPSDLATLTRNVSLPNYSNDKSFFINRKLNPFEIIKLLELLLEMPEEGLVALEPFGGRINEVPVNATAFVHRSAYYSFKIRYQTVNLDPARLQRGNAWVKRTFHVTKIVLQHNETYQNYPDKDLTDYLDRYYGTNLPRLIQIKKKYDRSNYFRGPQTIPTKRK